MIRSVDASMTETTKNAIMRQLPVHGKDYLFRMTTMQSRAQQSMSDPNPEPMTWRETFRVFQREFLEAIAYLWIVTVVADRSLSVLRLIRLAATVGAVQALVHRFDSQSHLKIKDGLYFSVGSSFVSA